MRPAADRWHLRGRLLPDGDEPVELWVADGRISTTPLPDCRPLGPVDGFLCPGLVDVHAHTTWSEAPLDDDARRRLTDDNREVFARQGTLLVRDMGAVVDSPLGWTLQGDGRATVVGCGRILLPWRGYPCPATRPGELVSAVAERIARGARWIKVFADWTDDFGGPLDTRFTGRDPVSYPLPELAAAVARAHADGARVAAHAFSREGAEVAVAAGVDTIEHGWGLHPGLFAPMAAQGTAWAPLLAIAPAMRQGARQAGDPERVAWIAERTAALGGLLPQAAAAGVVVLAGTDWGPGIPVTDEIRALHESGLSPVAALRAATTAARGFLGHPGIEHGAPADLLVFAEDPREDLTRLTRPAVILKDGRSVPPEPPAPPERPTDDGGPG